MIVQLNETKTLALKNENIKGYIIKMYLTAAATNTPITYAMINCMLVYLKLTLKRSGASNILLQDTLDVLNASLNFTHIPALLSMKASSGYVNLNGGGGYTLTAASLGVNEIDLLTYYIDLKSPITLTHNDELEMQITSTAACVTAGISLANSYFDITEVKAGQDFEKNTPEIATFSITQGVGRFTQALGSGVKEVYLINLDKGDQSLANSIISNVSLQSEQHNHSKVYIDLLNDQVKYYQTPLQAYQRGQSLIIWKGLPIDNCNLDLQLVAANVTSSNNYLVVVREHYSAQVAARGEALHNNNVITKGIAHGVVSAVHPDVQKSLSAARTAIAGAAKHF